jgi:hypothetical protein
MTERFRITVFGRPRSPWRDSDEEAMADAVALELASWDASRREWFLAVPVSLQSRRAVKLRGRHEREFAAFAHPWDMTICNVHATLLLRWLGVERFENG